MIEVSRRGAAEEIEEMPDPDNLRIDLTQPIYLPQPIHVPSR